MKIFFYSTHLFYTPHIETELELMQKHINNGDKVFRIICNGHLTVCDMNQSHELFTCLKCRDIRNSGKKLIDGEIINLSIIKNSTNYDLFSLNQCKTIDDLKKLYHKNFDIGYAIASSLISIHREPDFDILMNKEVIKRYYESALSVYLSGIEHIRKHRPDKVYVFNGRMAHVWAIVRSCESEQVEYITHERGGDMDHYDLFYNGLPHSLTIQLNRIQEYWEANKHKVSEKEQLGAKYYIDRKNGAAKDWYSYTKNQDFGRLPEGFDKSKTNIAIFNSSMDEFAAVSAEWKYPFYSNQEEFISNLGKMFEKETKYHFYLRVHPNLKGLKNSQLIRIKELKFDNLTVIEADSKISSYFLLDNCDKIITFGSTIGIEAAYWNKPSILVGPSLYDDGSSVHKAGSYEEVGSLLKKNLLPKNNLGALKYGYYSLVKGFKYDYFKPQTLLSGTFKNVDLMKSRSISTKVISKMFGIRFIGRPIAFYSKLYKKYKLKMHF